MNYVNTCKYQLRVAYVGELYNTTSEKIMLRCAYNKVREMLCITHSKCSSNDVVTMHTVCVCDDNNNYDHLLQQVI